MNLTFWYALENSKARTSLTKASKALSSALKESNVHSTTARTTPIASPAFASDMAALITAMRKPRRV